MNARRRDPGVQLEMTPMIDVVFQLLIFFVVVVKQQDILSHLEVSRPAGRPRDINPNVLEIVVYNQEKFGGEGYSLMDRQVSLRDLDMRFRRLASYDGGMPVAVKCTGDSPHANLVKVLDLCSKHRLNNISVLSM